MSAVRRTGCYFERGTPNGSLPVVLDITLVIQHIHALVERMRLIM